MESPDPPSPHCGSHYASAELRQAFEPHDMRQSMGCPAVCWDYALAESLFGVSKTEFVYRREYPSRRKLMRSVARNIATCYSRERIHSALEYLIYRWHTPTPCVGEGSIGPNWTDSSVGVSRGRTVNLPQGSPLNRTEHKIWYSHPDSDHYRLCSRWPGPVRWRALTYLRPG